MLSTSWIERRLNETDAYTQQLLIKLLEVEKDVKERQKRTFTQMLQPMPGPLPTS